MSEYRVIEGDTLAVLPTLESASAQTCITSPPYFGLRDYGLPPTTWADGWVGCLGLEPTPEMYVAHVCEVFESVRRVLRDDGTLWLNLGDSYNAYNGNRGPAAALNALADQQRNGYDAGAGLTVPSLKPKDMLGIPWMVAFALRADGWYLRSDIIWAKPNPMPESVTDRPTKAHEYLFLLSKRATYHYDADVIREDATSADDSRGRDRMEPEWADRSRRGITPGPSRGHLGIPFDGRNKRSVWTVASQPFPGAHFATFPPKLIEPCILAGSRPGDIVLDPFSGAGTTGVVALRHDRNYIGIELNPAYAQMARDRIYDDGPLLNVENAA